MLLLPLGVSQHAVPEANLAGSGQISRDAGGRPEAAQRSRRPPQ
jgi:hypothetical protein